MVAFRRIGQLGADAAKIDLQIANGLLHPIQDKNSVNSEECRDDVAFAKIGEQVRTVGQEQPSWCLATFGDVRPSALGVLGIYTPTSFHYCFSTSRRVKMGLRWPSLFAGY